MASDSVRVSFEGIGGALWLLQSGVVPKRLMNKAVRRAARESLIPVREEIKSRINDRSGRYKQSVRIGAPELPYRRRFPREYAGAAVKAHTFYAKFVERGTKHIDPQWIFASAVLNKKPRLVQQFPKELAKFWQPERLKLVQEALKMPDRIAA